LPKEEVSLAEENLFLHPPRKLSRSPSMKNIYWGAGAIDEIRLIRNYIPALPFASPTYAVSCFYLINA
jgi:hypothetical protein